MFSSPSRGSYISTSVLMICRWHFLSSRPLPGVLISLRNGKSSIRNAEFSSRPLPGVLISLLATTTICDVPTQEFSSPSRGSYISTMFRKLVKKRMIEFSSPSRGSYISTKMNNVTLIGRLFSSPSRGSYISTT